MTKFGKVTQVEEKHVFVGQARPSPKGGAQRPQIFLGSLPKLTAYLA